MELNEECLGADLANYGWIPKSSGKIGGLTLTEELIITLKECVIV